MKAGDKTTIGRPSSLRLFFRQRARLALHVDLLKAELSWYGMYLWEDKVDLRSPVLEEKSPTY